LVYGTLNSVLYSAQMFLSRKNLAPWAVLLLAVLLSMWGQFTNHISHDSAWLLYVAEGTLAGKELYRDYFIINLPMTVWINYPAIFLSEILGVPPTIGLKICVYIAISISLILCHYLLKTIDIRHKWALLLAAAITLILFPGAEFSQREHFFSIFLLPYLLLVTINLMSCNASTRLRLITGVFSVLGFLLKPHFVLVVIFLELCVLLRLRTGYFRRAEVYPLAFIGFCYYVSVVLFFPTFTKMVLPYASEVYAKGLSYNWGKIIGRAIPYFLLSVVLGLIVFTAKKQTLKTLGFVFVSVSVLCALIYFQQKKGYIYHLLPFATVAGTLGIYFAFCFYAPIFQDRKAQSVSDSSRLQGLLKLSLAGCLIFVLFGINKYQTYNYKGKFLNEYLSSNFSSLSSVSMYTSNVSKGFPLVNDNNYDWGMRYAMLLLPVGVANKRAVLGRSTELLDEIEEFSLSSAAEDLIRYKPDIVVVDVSKKKSYLKNAHIHYVEYFSQNPDFAAEWKNYDKVDTFSHGGTYASDYDIFERKRKTRP